jgi:hypothetical protein
VVTRCRGREIDEKCVAAEIYDTEMHGSAIATRNGQRDRDRYRGKEKQQFSTVVGSFRIFLKNIGAACAVHVSFFVFLFFFTFTKPDQTGWLGTSA